jgi:cilia- and flagella-associated protein 44
LDENVCPKGCEKKLYAFAFELRRERHEYEKLISAKLEEQEALQLEHDMMNQKLKEVTESYDKLHEKMMNICHQKQNLLNDIDACIILKMDQMQYFKNHAEFVDIDNTLLFNNHSVLRLYSRVVKLALEIIEAKRSHRINVVHLAKMKTDIKFMEKQIFELKDKVNQAMMKKFGRVIDLNEVEETILRRFAFEMQVEFKTNADEIKKHFANKINHLKVSFYFL